MPQFVSNRFVNSTKDEIAAVKERRYEKSTVNSTIWGVKIFKDWLREKNYSESFELLEPVQIDTLLAQFYVELRKHDGPYYSKVSYTGHMCLIIAKEYGKDQ